MVRARRPISSLVGGSETRRWRVDPVISSTSARIASTGRRARPTSRYATAATSATRAGSPNRSARRRASMLRVTGSTAAAPIKMSRPEAVSTSRNPTCSGSPLTPMANLTSSPASPSEGRSGGGGGGGFLVATAGAEAEAATTRPRPSVITTNPDEAVGGLDGVGRIVARLQPRDHLIEVGVDVVAEPADLGVLDRADQQPANHPNCDGGHQRGRQRDAHPHRRVTPATQPAGRRGGVSHRRPAGSHRCRAPSGATVARRARRSCVAGSRRTPEPRWRVPRSRLPTPRAAAGVW